MSDDFPILETPRLRLRRFTYADVPALFEFRSDPEVQRYNGGPMASPDEAVALIAHLDAGFLDRTQLPWALTLREGDDQDLGLFGFANWSVEHRRAEIGYCLHRDFWGQGLALEALTAIVAFGFGPMNLNRIHACPWVENVASTRILEKLGFRLEGVMRDEFWQNDAFHDEAHYALLRREFETGGY